MFFNDNDFVLKLFPPSERSDPVSSKPVDDDGGLIISGL